MSDEQRVTLTEALELGVAAHQAGEHKKAGYIYGEVLKAAPDNVDALQFMGVLLHQSRDNAAALERLARAAELAPNSAGVFMNYGNVLLEAGQTDAATDAFRRLLELAPEHAQAWNNMGVLLRAQGRTELAEEALRKAIALNPEDAGAYHNLGNLLIGTGAIEEAVECGLKAITLLPGSDVSKKLLGIAYAHLGETEKAKAVFAQWLAEDPGNPTAEHHLAALGDTMPDRASDLYVETTFDNFAASFDAKLENLGYRAPELVADELRALLAGRTARVLDVGCGTGLVGPLVRDLSDELVGIDLSGKMLDRARARGHYDRLEKAEFVGYLSAVDAPFGAIIAADALCYVGPMEAFAQNAFAASLPGAPFVGTFEADAEGRDVFLTRSGRYTHGKDYLTRTFEAAGFTVTAVKPEPLRMEQGRPVAGFVLCAVSR
ncbi:MAG: tetratricopeptide repeat protein [Pseudomonadota bacterium]